MIQSITQRFRAATEGIVAVEFALTVPVLLAVFFGGYSVSQCVAISRKVTITTRALADLTTQFATMSSTDMSTVINASSQIIAPFSATPMSLRLSEITTDSTGLIATVTWSVPLNMSAYATGSHFALPSSMQKPNTAYIYSEVNYLYMPLTALGAATIPIADHIFMLPRLTSSVSYSG